MSLTNFSGQYKASNFAYGLNSQVPGLMVVNGPNATGSGTLTLAFGYFVTADGYEVTAPLNTNAPITVGGSTMETVTPSAVSNSTPKVYAASTLTATFASIHGNGDMVRSGTAGLQEA